VPLPLNPIIPFPSEFDPYVVSHFAPFTHLTDFVSFKMLVLCPCLSTPSSLSLLNSTPMSFPTSPRSPT
jgi:hypothetical protein